MSYNLYNNGEDYDELAFDPYKNYQENFKQPRLTDSIIHATTPQTDPAGSPKFLSSPAPTTTLEK